MKILTIDIFGTLFVPRPSVAAQYLAIVQKHEKCASSVSQVQANFYQAFKQHYKEYPLYGKGKMGYESWWCHVIQQTFENKISLTTAKSVYEHFGSSQAYHLYDDVIPLLTTVRSMGFKTCALSNMDPKANDILVDFGLDKLLDKVFLSYDTGIDKPDPRAWEMVENAFGVSQRCYNSLYHVGDEVKKDLVSVPGWVAVLIDRSEGFAEYDEMAKKAVKMRDGVLRLKEDQYVVKDLGDVVDLLV
ncbi:Haloacid dehalogenase-like hydrolase domain-containing protein 3 [Yarrowia sp. B02]|nr:Haloacid dehalogenase-like hydrolase domain-containing protein 3 [Yarrowia sp. B02]